MKAPLYRYRIVLASLALLLGIPLLLLTRRPPTQKEVPEEARSLPERPLSGSSFSALVRQVIDGDTLRLAGGERVRLLGVDAPEHNSPLHAAARRALRDLVEGRRVRIETVAGEDGRDDYGRTLALVRAGDLLVNEELVGRGLARVYFKAEGVVPSGVARRLVKAQNRAIDGRLGLWSIPGALATHPGEELWATRFRYHRARCPKLSEVSSEGQAVVVRPTTREAALRAGKSPCRSCNP